MLEWLKKRLCKKEKFVTYKKGGAEFIKYDENSTATRVLWWLDRNAPGHNFVYGREKGTIVLKLGNDRFIVPFGTYFIIINGELYTATEKLIEGLLEI